MSKSFQGRCGCGALVLNLNLPHPLKCYAPRACDCDFCSGREIGWLSDPKGSLEIQCAKKPQTVRQGSQQAEFLSCTQCADVVAVMLFHEGNYSGAVNTKMLDEGASCKNAQSASPQKLSAEDKVRRWSRIWMPVSLEMT